MLQCLVQHGYITARNTINDLGRVRRSLFCRLETIGLLESEKIGRGPIRRVDTTGNVPLQRIFPGASLLEPV
jgi:hypothetical protein